LPRIQRPLASQSENNFSHNKISTYKVAAVAKIASFQKPGAPFVPRNAWPEQQGGAPAKDTVERHFKSEGNIENRCSGISSDSCAVSWGNSTEYRIDY